MRPKVLAMCPGCRSHEMVMNISYGMYALLFSAARQKANEQGLDFPDGLRRIVGRLVPLPSGAYEMVVFKLIDREGKSYQYH